MFGFKMQKGRAARAVALTLALVMLCGAISACSPKNKSAVDTPVLECGESGIPLYFYELLLSRMKGSLAANRYDVSSDAFWSERIEGSEQTYEDYFNSQVLDSCRQYLCALAIFDGEGLTLPEYVTAEIDEEIEFYISLGYLGGGDTEKFNKIIEAYGVNADTLKACYEIEAKYSYLLSYLYGANASLIADTVKEEFYEENYYRFKQILLPNFYYKYEVDEYGNEIYFDTESRERLYDKENGSPIYDENGNRLKDGDGNTIYFDADGNVLYDKVNGQRSVLLDGQGAAQQFFYTEAEVAERAVMAEEINAALLAGDFELFEAKMSEINVIWGGEESYPDGYYLSDIESASYNDYMVEMLDALKDMEVGETALIESEYGYHVIMRYPLDKGKYADGLYGEWFDAFNEALIAELFAEKCKSVVDITVNEENLKKARSIKEIGVNTDY